MSILPICGISIAGALLALYLSVDNKIYGKIVGMATACILLFLVVEKVTEFMDVIRLIEQKTKVDGIYVKILLKMTGITLACEVTSDLCTLADSSINAKHIKMVGRFCILSVGYPLVLELIELVDELLG